MVVDDVFEVYVFEVVVVFFLEGSDFVVVVECVYGVGFFECLGEVFDYGFVY